MVSAACMSTWLANVTQEPRDSAEIFNPLLPRRRYSMVMLPKACRYRDSTRASVNAEWPLQVCPKPLASAQLHRRKKGQRVLEDAPACAQNYVQSVRLFDSGALFASRLRVARDLGDVLLDFLGSLGEGRFRALGRGDDFAVQAVAGCDQRIPLAASGIHPLLA